MKLSQHPRIKRSTPISKNHYECLGEVMAKLVAIDGLTFNQIANSMLLRRAFKAKSCSLRSI